MKKLALLTLIIGIKITTKPKTQPKPHPLDFYFQKPMWVRPNTLQNPKLPQPSLN